MLSGEYEYLYSVSYEDHRMATNTPCSVMWWVPSMRLNTTQDANDLGNWLVQEFERLNPDCRILSIRLSPSGPGSLGAPERPVREEPSNKSQLAESVDNFILFIVLVGVLCAICGVISLFSGDSPSYEGLGGDPNPSSQSADPCSLFERNCDEGTTSGDTVPDENGDIIDR